MKPTVPASTEFEKAREEIHRQMLSAVSHDLKTPLATMIGSLEICTRMGDKLSKDKQETLIKSALTEAYRLNSFITNILDMAKLENGMVKVKFERVDMTNMLKDCITNIGPRAANRNIKLKLEGNTSIVNTDPMLLARAALLLLDNALRHGGADASVVITYGVNDTHAYIIVADNGPGIPKGTEHDIFNKYTRYVKSDQQNAGTGLGLAICQQIMNLLEGKVSVENNPEGGARFTLHFPFKS